jgi:hypothetical protein
MPSVLVFSLPRRCRAVLSQLLGERAAVQCPLPQLAVESRWPGWRRLCNAATPVRSTVNLLLGWNQQFLQLGVF